MNDLEKKHAAYRENFKIAFDLAGEYAKWLLSTLMLLNSGALAAIFQRDLAQKSCAVFLFGSGVLFAVGSGVLGWFNLQYSARYYMGAANDVLAGRTEGSRPRFIDTLRLWAIVAAAASVTCLMLGAAFAYWSLPLR